MRYITQKDEELIKTINLMTNMPVNKEKIYQQLLDYYIENSNNAEAAFSFGFYNFLITSKIVDSNINAEQIQIILKAYKDALEIEPDFWLVKMFKAILLLALPEVMQDESDLVATLEDMIDCQRIASERKPYFIIPYIIYADYNYANNKYQRALELIREAKKNNVKGVMKFKYLNDYFSKPLKDFSNRLLRSGEDSVALEIKLLSNKFFPKKNTIKSIEMG